MSDRAEQLFAENPVFNVFDFGGSFEIDRRSRLAARLVVHGEYEPELAQLTKALLRSGCGDFIDIGANVGFFSVLAAGLQTGGHRVLAIEPSPGALRLLNRNIMRNGLSGRIEVFDGLVSDGPGARMLAVIEGNEEFASIGSIAMPFSTAKQPVHLSVRSSTLDDLVCERGLAPSLIKMDVEGAEGLVLRGSKKTLEKYRPMILAEFSPGMLAAKGTPRSSVERDLAESGYVVLPILSKHLDFTSDVLICPAEGREQAEAVIDTVRTCRRA